MSDAVKKANWFVRGWNGFWAGVGAFLSGVWTFIKDRWTDVKGLWDSKLIFGDVFLSFSIYYVGWLKPGDIVGFLAIAGVGAFLHGWSASPWGGSSPDKTGSGS